MPVAGSSCGSVTAEELQGLVEGVEESGEKEPTFFGGGLRRSSDYSGWAVAVDSKEGEVGT
jgi:hypothetical protein